MLTLANFAAELAIHGLQRFNAPATAVGREGEREAHDQYRQGEHGHAEQTKLRVSLADKDAGESKKRVCWREPGRFSSDRYQATPRMQADHEHHQADVYYLERDNRSRRGNQVPRAQGAVRWAKDVVRSVRRGGGERRVGEIEQAALQPPTSTEQGYLQQGCRKTHQRRGHVLQRHGRHGYGYGEGERDRLLASRVLDADGEQLGGDR